MPNSNVLKINCKRYQGIKSNINQSVKTKKVAVNKQPSDNIVVIN